MEALLPYLPTDRRHALASGIELPDRTHGSALFVDISGFTALAEALARDLGAQRGAEELTFFLNSVYDVIIADLHRYHGSVIGFSGDAITCWFDGDDGSWAAASALAMQESMQQFDTIPMTSGDTVTLAAKAGLSVGEARRFVVGGTTKIDVLAGSLLDEMAEAEHRASRGQVVLGPSAVRTLGERVRAAPAARSTEGFAIASQLTSNVEPDPWGKLTEGAFAEDQLRPWLLPEVFERLQAGQGDFLAELRPAIAVFMRFDGLDYDGDDAAGQKLDDLVRRVQGVLTQYDGTLVDITTGDKGSHLYIAFGAPTAHEDDLERAVSAALELRDIAASHSAITSVQFGISRGRMRTGAYGARTRRTYGVLGDATNLAARLMQAAEPGAILMSQVAAQPLERAFTWKQLPPITVKGKSEPIGLVELVDRSSVVRAAGRSDRRLLPMVGRESELAAARDKLASAAAGVGQIIGITAPAGMGKSRLLAEVVSFGTDGDPTVLHGECKSYGASIAYLPWEGIWRHFFDLDGALAAAEQIKALHDRISRLAPSLAPRLPLLGSVLNLSIPDSELTRSFDAKLRKTSLESMLVELVRLRSQQEPLVLAIEDTHWIDPLSNDLLLAIAQSVSRLPAAIVLAYRPVDDEQQSFPIKSLPNFTEIQLDVLADEQAAQWISLKINQLYGSEAKASDKFIARLIERAEGNPFYIEEVLNYLKDHGIPPSDEGRLAEVELPSSLHSLVLTRIDRLAERPRSVLRVASVVGRSFSAADIKGAYPGLDERQVTDADLAELERKGFAELEESTLAAFRFKHSVIQEVAYESLPHATRTELHGSYGRYLERNYPESLEQHVYRLAYHFDRSDLEPKKREYLNKAGQAAQSTYANGAAIDYYRKLLPLVSEGERAEIELKLGQVHELLGEWNEAKRVLLSALEVSQTHGLLDVIGRAQTALGEVHRKQGEYQEANEWLDRARATFDAQANESGLAQVLHYAGTLAAQQGDYQAAVGRYQESLGIRKKLDEQPGIASLLSNLGIISRFQGDLERSQELNEESLAIRRSVGDKWAIANSLNNQGTVYLDQEEFDLAGAKLEEAVGLLREIGDRWHYANALNNLANVARARGDYQRAWDLYEESLQRNRELGDSWALAYLLDDIGVLSVAEGRPARAVRLVAAAHALRDSAGAPLSPKEQDDLDQRLKAARDSLSSDEFEAAWEEGLVKTLDEALEYALSHAKHAQEVSVG